VLLENKIAVIYGGGGLIGGAAARAFAREGARVFLAGRTLATLDKVAADIAADGGRVETAQVDALDEGAVEEHLAAVVDKAGGIDVSFNAIGIRGELQGTPLVDLSLEDYETPIAVGTTAHFLTARAAARHMIDRRSGVILLLTATATWNKAALRTPIAMGGFGAACAAIEGLSRSLAGELGPYGIRVACLRAEGTAELLAAAPDFAGFEPGMASGLRELLESETLLRRLPTVAEVANAAALLASDHAAAMTATIANVNCGAVPG
jgi:NAD(P)-dependent dehydrogenase (short-subunit alcohol dehydrogenase family)